MHYDPLFSNVRAKSLFSWVHDGRSLLIIVHPFWPHQVFALAVASSSTANRQGLTKGKKNREKLTKPKMIESRTRPELAS